MQLYVGSARQFVRDTVQNQITDRLREAFFAYYGHRPAPSETYAWTNSLRAMSLVIQHGGFEENGVLLEYQLPLSSRRIDCMLTGTGETHDPRAVLVELKQWEACEPADGEHVVTWVGGGHRDVLHPCVQVDQYRQYLQEFHTAFHEVPPVRLDACAYLHNYGLQPHDPLEEPRFEDVRKRSPLFTKDDVDPLVDYLQARVGQGPGEDVLERVVGGAFRPSRTLMSHVSDVIEGNGRYILLDEQLVVRDKILALLERAIESGRKEVVIVHGGPGTGKSVIALHVMAELLKRGRVAHYATGSQAFNATLAEVVGKRGAPLFRSFYSYARAPPNAVDVLIADEAHRIRKDNNLPWTPRDQRSDTPQVETLLAAARVGVFFIDDHQSVTPRDAGSAESIRQAAARVRARVHEHTLDIQFRCGGADAFIQWVENTLDIRRSATVLWEPNPHFEFKLMDEVDALDAAIGRRQHEGHQARLVAGFCWPWSDPDAQGRLVSDVRVGSFQRPWNAKSGAKRLAEDVPPEKLWAYDPRGAGQVGCVYTAQGFEFDYVGVIMGRDLTYDPKKATWVGNPQASHDATVKRAGAAFTDLVKRTYRVLLTRGLKGCYLYAEDEATRDFLRSRMRRADAEP